MKTVEVGAIGVGWVGGTRVETLSRTSLVDKLHLCDIKPDRLAELKLAASEDLAEVAITTGRARDVTAELERLAATHPLRERLAYSVAPRTRRSSDRRRFPLAGVPHHRPHSPHRRWP